MQNVLLIHNYYRTQYTGGEDIIFDNEYLWLKQNYDGNIYKYNAYNDRLKIISRNIFYSKHHYENIYGIIKEKNIEIVHLHNPFFNLTPSVIKAAKDAGAVVVQTIHNYRWWCPNGVYFNPSEMKFCQRCVKEKFPISSIRYKCNYNSILKSTFIAFSNYLAKKHEYYKLIDKFIVMSNYGRLLLKEIGVKEDHIVIKPHSIDSIFKRKKSRNRGKYLYIGRIDKLKGIDLLIKAFNALSKEYELSVIGSGPDMHKLSKIACNDNIKFYGNLEHNDIYKYLDESSFLIMPSLMPETFGLTIIEAMSFGVPVIGTAIGTRKELIQDGKTGYLFKPYVNELINTIKVSNSINNDQYNEISSKAFEFSGRFKKEVIMKELINIYRELIDDR